MSENKTDLLRANLSGKVVLATGSGIGAAIGQLSNRGPSLRPLLSKVFTSIVTCQAAAAMAATCPCVAQRQFRIP